MTDKESEFFFDAAMDQLKALQKTVEQVERDALQITAVAHSIERGDPIESKDRMLAIEGTHRLRHFASCTRSLDHRLTACLDAILEQSESLFQRAKA